MLSMMEGMTNKKVNTDDRDRLIRGASEVDLVHSGLEDTMIGAYLPIRDAWRKNKKIEDLRTAAFYVAIEKVATAYMELGIFP